MRLNTSVALCLLAAVSNAIPTPQEEISPADLPTEASPVETEANDQLAQLAEFAAQTTNETLAQNEKRGGCSLWNVSVRREWSALSKKERKAYTDAVLCLQSKPARTPSSLIPGAKSRFDDFVGTHINQTNNIHYTGTFLTWHRYFTWSYEQALRNECGYTGVQPYWDWALSSLVGLENTSMLDGSDYSMSGNGENVEKVGDIQLGGSPGLPALILPTGTGGGCVTSGPFKNMKVNLGPAGLALPGGTTVANGDGLGYNPRCLKRDLTDVIIRKYSNATAIANTILKPKDVYDFQMTMQGVPGSGNIGIHGGGHYAMGGDPGRDVNTSPAEPLFYLHHAMIDRVWWIWQLLDKSERTGAEGISGTGTFLNNPPSANTTLDTVIDLGYAAGPPMTVRDLMSTTDGPFCYTYL
ncbi:Di-copper centre-containing protein [Bimuria novae-zelandiae CBS 107.79]|uniref:Di-copper centre-containing protein n=1 Tax=Bimuria novae-zelandiae CBS 107.79 TaxID=1447943 RepID=A0A6A5VEE5_9PLEO|nr:Di-copper centre-containing protein [Bimuria novae-zelandiae CBS 107.79]